MPTFGHKLDKSRGPYIDNQHRVPAKEVLKVLSNVPLREHPLSTYAPRGRGVLKKWPIFGSDSTDRLRELRTRGREGVQKA